MKKLFKNIANYFKGVKKEIKQVRWTSSKDLAKYSITALSFMIFLGIYFYAIDLLVSLLRSVA